jgi:hypothetical protein
MSDDDGAGLDVATRFDLAGKLEVAIGAGKRSAAALDRIDQRLNRPPQQPVFDRFSAADVIPAGGFKVLRLGGPDQGHFWYVRQISVGGESTTTAAAGRADVFVSGTDLRTIPGLTSLGLADWRDQAITLPLIAYYGRGALSLRSNEELFIAFSSATVAQQYVAACSFEDFEESPAAITWDA